MIMALAGGGGGATFLEGLVPIIPPEQTGVATPNPGRCSVSRQYRPRNFVPCESQCDRQTVYRE